MAPMSELEKQVSRLKDAVNRVNSSIGTLVRIAAETKAELKHLRLSDMPNIPPKWVLVAARNELNRTNHWVDYYAVLSEYYGIPGIEAKKNPKLAPNVIACFVSEPNPVIQSREASMDDLTALHEYFHFLMFRQRGFHSGDPEQALCDAFAQACLAEEKRP